ncbi:hypothetical protein BOTCAL_0710g00020 [Botryotinia calthae]|uniref:Uncharacterized protein n=1 Tax=Botryotinia calthae TaxID=38488 RepID=A0A4Y8CHS5_9HELO|nr:hypothetical protein BOTCAL_0710g00020 [Botryotinia calthae]
MATSSPTPTSCCAANYMHYCSGPAISGTKGIQVSSGNRGLASYDCTGSFHPELWFKLGLMPNRIAATHYWNGSSGNYR